ncbi:MAG: DUF4290 domain-containing protein [Bacteroidales bacterium]|nr:DUF4290 domain-containing protein [Bacteroidales bacterium]
MEGKLSYNTGKERIRLPEYGRYIMEMAEGLREIEDRELRSRQAAAIVKSMEILNPQVHSQDNFEHKLWDHLYMIAGTDLDIDSPWPAPVEAQFTTRPVPLPMKDSRIRARHYGRNIERIIDLLCEEPDGEVKTAMIRSLAVYMRQQYLIWNKDNVDDSTIFSDIEKLSGYKLKVPEGISLEKISQDANFSRPGMSINLGYGGNSKNRNNQRKNFKGRKK